MSQLLKFSTLNVIVFPASQALKKAQTERGVQRPLSLIQDVVTRWNSQLSMVNRLLLFLTEMTSRKTTSARIKVIGDPERRANPDILHAPGITASMDVITVRGPVTVMHQLTRDKFYKVMNCLQTDEQLTLTPQTKVIHISKLFFFICMYRQRIDYIIKLTASKIKS